MNEQLYFNGNFLVWKHTDQNDKEVLDLIPVSSIQSIEIREKDDESFRYVKVDFSDRDFIYVPLLKPSAAHLLRTMDNGFQLCDIVDELKEIKQAIEYK
jgi:hypothetical protein